MKVLNCRDRASAVWKARERTAGSVAATQARSLLPLDLSIPACDMGVVVLLNHRAPGGRGRTDGFDPYLNTLKHFFFVD